MEHVRDLLHKKGLKKTKLRAALLDCFLHSKHAMSYLDIKEKLGIDIDKSTLYRNLSTFEESEIIHRINDQSGITKYAIGKVHDHGSNHAHFVCDTCETVYCVEGVNTTELSIPKGFKAKTVQTILRGTCSDC